MDVYTDVAILYSQTTATLWHAAIDLNMAGGEEMLQLLILAGSSCLSVVIWVLWHWDCNTSRVPSVLSVVEIRYLLESNIGGYRYKWTRWSPPSPHWPKGRAGCPPPLLTNPGRAMNAWSVTIQCNWPYTHCRYFFGLKFSLLVPVLYENGQRFPRSGILPLGLPL